MTNFARIIGNVAIDVSAKPNEHFHPDIAKEFVSVPDQVKPGWRKTGSTWAAPEPAPIAEFAPPSVTPPQFYMLFSMAEQLELEELKLGNPIIALGFKRLEDPRLTEVDLAAQSVQELIRYSLTQIDPTTVDARFADIIQGQWK